jgi:hypothetical protein
MKNLNDIELLEQAKIDFINDIGILYGPDSNITIQPNYLGISDVLSITNLSRFDTAFYDLYLFFEKWIGKMIKLY